MASLIIVALLILALQPTPPSRRVGYNPPTDRPIPPQPSGDDD